MNAFEWDDIQKCYRKVGHPCLGAYVAASLTVEQMTVHLAAAFEHMLAEVTS